MAKIEQTEHFQTHVHTFCLLMPAGDFSPPYIIQCTLYNVWFKSPKNQQNISSVSKIPASPESQSSWDDENHQHKPLTKDWNVLICSFETTGIVWERTNRQATEAKICSTNLAHIASPSSSLLMPVGTDCSNHPKRTAQKGWWRQKKMPPSQENKKCSRSPEKIQIWHLHLNWKLLRMLWNSQICQKCKVWNNPRACLEINCTYSTEKCSSLQIHLGWFCLRSLCQHTRA